MNTLISYAQRGIMIFTATIRMSAERKYSAEPQQIGIRYYNASSMHDAYHVRKHYVTPTYWGYPVYPPSEVLQVILMIQRT